MTISENDRLQEEQRLQMVLKQISVMMEQLEAAAGGLRAEVVEGRQNFWDDVSINFSNPEDWHETFQSIKQQALVLGEREQQHRRAHDQLKKLALLQKSPYFGRIDFQEQGFAEMEQVYIGIASLMNEDTFEHYVYDWRAPISSLFYDYSLGSASYVTPVATITGEIRLKRQYQIENSEMKFMFDTGIAIRDEVLQQVLGKQAETQMRSIVATIQQEQNRIIRSNAKTVIVQGAAGSGKTSVALQRVAYLLYKYRDTLHPDQMVLFSPNPIFNQYVAHVLPELGETNIRQTTFQEYLERQLGDSYQLEDAYDQLEYRLTAADHPEYHARISGIRFKGSADFYRMIENYKRLLLSEGMCFCALTFRDKTLIGEDQMTAWFYDESRAGTGKLHLRIEMLKEYLLEELEHLEKAECSESWVEEEVESLDHEQYQQAYQRLYKKGRMRGNTFDDARQEYELLSRMVVHKRFEPLRQSVEQLQFVDMGRLYLQLFADHEISLKAAEGIVLPDSWQKICQNTTSRLHQGKLAYEDATPVVLLKELVAGDQRITAVKYVLIDEGQDYTPFQYLFLRKLFPYSQFTVLGDLNQAIMHVDFAPRQMLPLDDLDQPAGYTVETFRLTKSYRSTKEITEFTRKLLSNADHIEPFNRSGNAPSLISASDSGALHRRILEEVNRLRADGIQSIAIICRTAEESETAFATLQGEIPVRLITKESTSIVEGILVIPVYLAKGVEFDAVLVYQADAYSSEDERLLFYTVCTRAMHHLSIFYVEELPKICQGLIT